ncbi:MAG TPA: hypothetical protein VJA21_04060 [Verrucomicrobiae bacterium]
MKPKLVLRLSALLALLAVGITANAQVWLGTQLGNPAFQGSIVTNTDNTLTVVAGGNDIWNASDNGYFYYTWVQGDFDAKVYVNSLINSSAFVDAVWAKAEMMVRWSDPAAGVQGSDAFIAAMSAPGQGTGTGAQYRPARSAAANNVGGTGFATKPPQWLRLTRTNQTFTVLSSADGTVWDTLQTIDVTAAVNGFGAAWPNVLTLGVAVTAHDNNNTTVNNTTVNFNAPVVSSAGPAWSPPTASGISRDVASLNTHLGSEASFSFQATNNAVPTQFTPQYQWYRDGNLIPGMTRTAHTFLATAADNNAQFKCVSWPEGYPSITVTSSVGILTVANDSVAYTNGVKVEIFAGRSRGDVEANNTGTGDTGTVSAAGKLVWKPTFEDGGGYGDNTSRRYSAWILPPADGNYTFYVASDDDTDVFLSTDANPANKRIICQEPQWSGFNNWTNAGGGGAGAIALKCSDTWTNDANPTPPFAGGINLLAANRYYVEMVLHNGGGGDNGSLTMLPTGTAGPANGQPSTLGAPNNNLVMLTFPMPITPASFIWTTQPTNTAVDEAVDATFYARATSDSEFRPNYQWLLNGANISGATRTSYTISKATPAQNGTTYSLVATLPTLVDGLSSTISITSSVATLTVRSAVFEPGFVLNERWNGPNNWGGARDNTLGTPNYVAAIPAFEAAVDNPSSGQMVNYTRRISGLFIPPSNGTYVFFVCSDDNSALFLSTDANPVNKVQVAMETGWSNPWQWTSSGDGSGNGGSDIWQKRSDQYTNATAGNFNPVLPAPRTITLTGGTRYYIEDDGGQGTGGGNFEATFKLLGETDPANGTDTRLTGTVIGMLAPKCNWVRFTLEPTNPPPVAAGGASSATFYAFGDSDSKLPVGSIRSTTVNGQADEQAGQYVFFQWVKNGQEVPGATATSFTLTGLRTNDNNTQVYCRMRALGYGLAPNTRYWSNSTTATLTVTADPTVPALIAAGAYQNPRDFKAYVSLTFNAPIDPFTATNPASYTVSGGATVYNVAWFSPDYRRILLEVSFISPPVTVSVTGLSSWSGVALPPVSNFAAYEFPANLTWKDIGAGTDTAGITDPLLPSKLWLEGTNAWTIAATGHDIWDNADGFTFLYETKLNDFDVVMRQTQYGLNNRWAKCGLMAREGINGVIDDYTSATAEAGRSRNWTVVNDPKDIPMLSDGNGANEVECGYRYASTNVGTATWWPEPFNRIVVYRPQYPNAWLRLKRVGQVLTSYAGNDGINWWKTAETTVTANTNNPTALPDAMFVGVCATAHHNPTAVSTDPVWYNYASLDNYNSSYTGGNIVGGPGTVVFTGTQQGADLVLNWTFPGTVQLQWSADLINWNNFTPMVSTPPVTVPMTQAKAFYRVRP